MRACAGAAAPDFPPASSGAWRGKQPGAEKYLICNADEGDPGAFMDRALLEGDPHAVLEGMLDRRRTPSARRTASSTSAPSTRWPSQRRHRDGAGAGVGLLGKNILGTGFDFDIEIREGAGAFVCGEESALIASLEGHRGMPRPRPPFPVQSGYLGQADRASTTSRRSANVPLIFRKGKDWYRSIGTAGSTGTKIFALAGKVNNTGLVEVPMGATLRQIIFDIGGGIPKNRRFKAAQMGGPSGGCVPAQYLDLPLDYDSVKKIGAIMGSGGLIVMDENTCMVDIARFFLEFTQSESCGKCVPCRVGTRHMLDILQRICAGEGREGDIEALERLARERQAVLALRAGPDRAEPGAHHDPVFPRGVRGAHPAQALPRLRVRGARARAVRARVPGGGQRAGVPGARRRGPARRRGERHPPPQPVRLRLRARLRPSVRTALPPRATWTSRSPSARSSGSPPTTRRSTRPRSCRRRRARRRSPSSAPARPA